MQQYEFKIGEKIWVRTPLFDKLNHFKKKWDKSRTGEFWYQDWIPKEPGDKSEIWALAPQKEIPTKIIEQ